MAKYNKTIRGGYEYYYSKVYNPKTQTQKELFAKTIRELDKKVQEYKEKLNAGIKNDNIRFSIFLKTWLYEVHLIDKKPSTKERYSSIYKTSLFDCELSKIKLKDLNTLDIQKFYNKVFEEKNSASAVKQIHKLISPSIRYAAENGYIPRDFSKSIKLPKDTMENQLLKQQKNNVKPLTLPEQISFVQAIADHDLEALFSTALDTGARQGELFALTWADINFTRLEIDLHKTYKVIKNIDTGKYEPYTSPPKTVSSIRKIPMPKRTAFILSEHQIKQKIMLEQYGISQTKDILVFCTPLGTHFDSHNILKRLNRIFDGIDIHGKTFHDLRHTYATRLFELGEDPKTVQSLLGHSSLSTTLDTYTHVLENLKEKTATKIDELYANLELDKK